MTLAKKSDIARAMYLGTKEVFMDNLKKQPTEQWKSYATVKDSNMMEETYDSVGNLKPAHIKAEGDPVVYGKIVEAYKTTVKNETVANGFSVTMEAQEDEKWGLVPEVKVNELVRTMISKKEQAVAAIWDNVTTATGADGAKYASHIHPLLNSGIAHNSNLVEDTFDINSYQDGVKKFNHWRNHFGDKFFTTPSAILAHRDRQTNIFAMLQSSLMPFENTNTKNTIPQLKVIFSNYISALQVHILDETIDSGILQKRKGMKSGYHYDEKETFNFYFNVHERYKAAMINPGFGFVTITGSAASSVVKLAADSAGVAGNGTITTLTTNKKYKITFGGITLPIAADGTIIYDTDLDKAVAISGTAITGLVNGLTYKVEEISA